MPTYPREIPVVVVGSGPTGLTTANLLAAYGVDCIVLEREPQPLNLPRAIVLDDEGSRTLQVFGLDKTYVASTTAGDGSRYYDDKGRCFAETGAGLQTYGFAKRQFIYQPEMEAALSARLEAQAPGTLFFASEVRDVSCRGDHAIVSVCDADGTMHAIRTRWVLACDGGRSPIRERLGIAMIGNTYEQDWIVLDTTNDPDHSIHSKFFCSNVRPTVSVPAPNGGRRYEFMLLPGETADEVLAPAFLSELLEPFRRYDETEMLRKTVYTFHARIAECFRRERILLMGDAAHLTPPFAGQGMNAGLRDAHNVAWKIAAVLKGGADDGILDTYETERRKPAWDMIQLAVTMGNVVMPAGEEQIAFRDMLLKALHPYPDVRDYLIQMRFKPKPRCHAGLFLDLEQPVLEASLVGEMIPQPDILDNGSKTLLDEKLGSGFALISQDDKSEKALSGMHRTEFLGLPLATLHLAAMDAVEAASNHCADGEIARPLRTHRDQILLVRPDRYCAAAIFPDRLDDELARYESLFSADNRSSSPEISPAVAMSTSR